MSALHYPDLHIHGFRGFKDLEIPRLGRVTLITGKNNTGKSSLLEALRLHAHNAAPRLVYDILRFREESAWGVDEEERLFDPESVLQVSALFHGFPQLPEAFGPIVISTSSGQGTTKLEMRVDWVSEELDADGRRRMTPKQPRLLGESDDIAALVVSTEEHGRTYRLEGFARRSALAHRGYSMASDEARMPCILVSPFSGERTGGLGSLWDGIALTDNENDVVRALQIIDPKISAVSMVGGEAHSRVRRAIVRADDIPRPVPLRSFGDGMNRLFAIVLSLVNSRGGVLLVDEFENGLHYSVQLDAWRMIFRLAQNLDAQVFATTHSQDAIGAFHKAAAESSEDGVLLRLTRKGDAVIPTVASEDELAVATRHDVEVR